MVYASKKMDGACAIFEQEEPPTACPALTMPPPEAGAGHTTERFVLSDGEADGESDGGDESEPEEWSDSEFWYGPAVEEFDDAHHGPREIPT